MPQEIARQWFVPGDGIDRHVISADIQRYLGNDATVRPGLGTGENQGVQGYWIKAYRNLTSAMIADLRADSARWRQEQRQTGTREPYVGSSTYQASSAARTSQARRDGDSPSLEGPYGPPPPRERIPVDSRMQIDPPQQSRSYQSDNRAQYPPDGRAFPADSRGYAPDGGRSQYQPDPAMSSGFGARPQVSMPYGQEPRYAPSYSPQGIDGAPPGYVRQGNFYVPVSSYDPAPPMPVRADNYGPDSFGQPQGGRDSRDPRYQQQEYGQDPSNFGSAPPQQYNQYGGGMPALPSAPPTRPPGGNPSRQGAGGAFTRPSEATAGRGSGGGGSNNGGRSGRR